VRAEVERRAQESSNRGSVDAHVPRPFTADAKRALELSLREALNLGDHHINELHLALGVLRWDDSAAADVLRALDIDSERVRRVLLETVMPHTAGEPYVPRGLERLAGRMRRRGGEREVEDTVHQLTLQVERLDAQVTRLTEIVERLDRDRPG
jgi:ATP-dependent Clp protease ATP-binding subunit ClpA